MKIDMYRKTFLTIIKQLGKISDHTCDIALKAILRSDVHFRCPAYSRRTIVVEHKELAQSIENTSI